jgi:phosphatidylserine/phosphatidylglycerophosphate/cardiolipin synthase-like enzyme
MMEMTVLATTDSLTDLLGQFVGKGYQPNKATQTLIGDFGPDYPDDNVTLYSPDDDVHGALVRMYSLAHHSLVVAMYGYDDEQIARVIKGKMADPNLFVQLSFDSSQAGGVHEKQILAMMQYPGNLVAYGRSERGSIMHLKMAIIDGLYVVFGSTNLSDDGETKQDNQLTVVANRAIAARARTKCDLIHAGMQQQMVAKGIKLG